MNEWLENFKACGVQWNFSAFGRFWGFCLWPENPPCTGSWFGCWHISGEPGHEDYEMLIPITRTRNWGLLLNSSPKESKP